MLAALLPVLTPIFKDPLDRAFPNEAERARAEAEINARLVEITARPAARRVEMDPRVKPEDDGYWVSLRNQTNPIRPSSK